MVFFIFLVLLALAVVFTCIWKIVNIIALYTMETRIEELEHMAKNKEYKVCQSVVLVTNS